MSASRRIDELHGEAELGSGLAKTAFHHVASAEFLADGADIP